MIPAPLWGRSFTCAARNGNPLWLPGCRQARPAVRGSPDPAPMPPQVSARSTSNRDGMEDHQHLPQQPIIDRIKQVCAEDNRIVASMLYGSFPAGEADIYSDIDVVVYVKDDAFETLDKREWLGRVGPIILHVPHDFGFDCAVFEGMICGEFHFERASAMEQMMARTRENMTFPSIESTLLVDKTGELTRLLEPALGEPKRFGTTDAEVQRLLHSFIHWFHAGLCLGRRGEYARAHDFIWWVHHSLIGVARVLENTTTHWMCKARMLEQDLSAESYARFAACTATLDPASLRSAYGNSWEWMTEMIADLQRGHDVSLPPAYVEEVDKTVRRVCHCSIRE